MNHDFGLEHDLDVIHRSAPLGAWASLSLVRQADGTPMPDDEPASVALYLREIFPATREDIEGLIRDIRAIEELLPT